MLTSISFVQRPPRLWFVQLLHTQFLFICFCSKHFVKNKIRLRDKEGRSIYFFVFSHRFMLLFEIKIKHNTSFINSCPFVFSKLASDISSFIFYICASFTATIPVLCLYCLSLLFWLRLSLQPPQNHSEDTYGFRMDCSIYHTKAPLWDLSFCDQLLSATDKEEDSHLNNYNLHIYIHTYMKQFRK